MSSTATTEKSGLTLKELAFYIGIPIGSVCIAGGLYYIYKRSSKTEDIDSTDSEKQDDDDVKIEADTINEDPKEKAQLSKSRGNKYFQAGRFEKAIELYTQAIEQCPKEDVAAISTFYQNRAAANEKLEKWEEVVADCTEAIQLNPKYSKALHRRARAYEELNRNRECLEDVTAVCLLDGFQNQPCMILADRILKSIGKELAAEHFKKRPYTLPSATFIKSYLDSFNEDLFTVSDDSTDSEDELYVRISKDIANKEYNEIVDLCTQVIKSGGNYNDLALLLRGTMKTLMCDVESAMNDFDDILSLEDSNTNQKLKVDALIKRGSLKMQRAQDQECYADFEKAIQIDDSNANIYHHRGQLYFLTDRLEEAQKDFEKSIYLDPKFAAPRIQLGYCLCKIAMQQMSPTILRESSEMLNETTRLFPDCVEAWSLYGQLLQDQQNLPEASEKLEKAISLSPNNPTTYVYKALLLLQWKQDLNEANKLIRKAIELDPKCDFAYETLATLEVQKGNNEEAIKLFEKAIDLVRTEAEMANTFSLLEAAKAQSKVTKLYGITLPTGLPGM